MAATLTGKTLLVETDLAGKDDSIVYLVDQGRLLAEARLPGPNLRLRSAAFDPQENVLLGGWQESRPVLIRLSDSLAHLETIRPVSMM